MEAKCTQMRFVQLFSLTPRHIHILSPMVGLKSTSYSKTATSNGKNWNYILKLACSFVGLFSDNKLGNYKKKA